MKKPIHFLIFKIVGVAGAILAIIALALIFTGFGDFESNNFMIGGFLLPLAIFATVTGFVIGFKPQISKMTAQGTRYILEENKEELSDIATTTAEIASEGVEMTARAVARGLEDTIFCKHCGAQIDADSRFCSKCGKEQ